MRCWRYDITQTVAELNHISETIWRQVSRNRGDMLLISFDSDARKFIIEREGYPSALAITDKRRSVEKIMRRHYYADVLFHGTD